MNDAHRREEMQSLRRSFKNPNLPKPEALFLDAGYVLIERDPRAIAGAARAALGREYSEERIQSAIISAQRHFYAHVAEHGFPDKFGDAPDEIPALLSNEYAGLLAALSDGASDVPSAQQRQAFFSAVWAIESKGDLYVKMMNPRLNEILRRIRHVAHIRLVMVSNASDLLHHMLQVAGVDVSYFEAILASEVVSFKKPQREFFQVGLDRLALSANQVIFVDDAPSYIDPVKDWMRCVHFDPYKLQPGALPTVPICTDLAILADALSEP